MRKSITGSGCRSSQNTAATRHNHRNTHHPADKRRPEPVVDLSAVQQDLQRARTQRDQRNPDSVDIQLAAASRTVSLLRERGRIMHKTAGQK